MIKCYSPLLSCQSTCYFLLIFFFFFLQSQGRTGARAKIPQQSANALECRAFSKSQAVLEGPSPSRASFLHFKVSSLVRGSGNTSWDMRIKWTGFQIRVIFFWWLFDYINP